NGAHAENGAPHHPTRQESAGSEGTPIFDDEGETEAAPALSYEPSSWDVDVPAASAVTQPEPDEAAEEQEPVAEVESVVDEETDVDAEGSVDQPPVEEAPKREEERRGSRRRRGGRGRGRGRGADDAPEAAQAEPA